MWNKVMVMFGGYGFDCTLEETGTPGIYCRPDGPAYYLGDTWHYDMNTCPNGCTRNGTCHYGACVCDPWTHGLDCSNRTCPDCTTMDRSLDAVPCEVWDKQDNPVVFVNNPDPKNPVTESNHLQGAGLTAILSNASILDGNCWYDYGWQTKRCRVCSLRGTCDYRVGKCVCDPLFSNFDCSYMACPHPSCNDGGACLLNGRCVCRYAYFEMDCSINFECPNDCSFQGICEPFAKCRCYEGFFGKDCSIAIAYSGCTRLPLQWPTILAFLASAMLWLAAWP